MRYRKLFMCMLLLAMALPLSCSGSREITLKINNPSPLDSPKSQTLMAGVARADITPPPGLPMAGYSVMSEDGRGFRTRLMARVFYLKPSAGRPVALVQCDLLSGSLIVHHRVAELIASKTDIGTGGLVMAATHTHSAAGNYFANMFYNDNASNRPGFDNTYFDFLSRQIADAVIRAYAVRRPAKLAVGTTQVTGVARNRSLPAYLRNADIARLETPPDIRQAVNPDLHLIRIDGLDSDGVYKPMGAFTLFSLHPNTNPAELGEVYSGDIFAFSERSLEQKIRHAYAPPWDVVHGAANFTHGDNNPDYPQDRVETFADLKRMGDRIAEKAFTLFRKLDGRLKADPVILFQAKEIDMFEDNQVDGISIAERPVVGMATLAGAQGRGRTSFVSGVPFFAPGWPRWVFTDGPQGHKRWAGGPLQYLYLSKADFPHLLFLQAVLVDDLLMLPLPFEITYEMGTRIARSAAEAGRASGLAGIRRSAAVGVSNGYFGYVTTPEEYSLQYYEGGSTLYGPHTGEFLSAHTARLVRAMAGRGSGGVLPEGWSFTLDARSYYPKQRTPAAERHSLGAPVYCPATEREAAHWIFQYEDVPACRIDWHVKFAGVEIRSDDDDWGPLVLEGMPVDDRGGDMAILWMGEADQGMDRYEIRWYVPDALTEGWYRFAVAPRPGQPIFFSDAFHLNKFSKNLNIECDGPQEIKIADARDQ